MRKIYIASHGEFSKGLKNSLEMICGDKAKDINIYCMKIGDSATDFAAELEIEISSNENDEFIVFTDLFGASVCSSLIPLTVHKNFRLFSGMNINILLCFILEEPDINDEKAIKELIDMSREGLKLVNIEINNKVEDF
jgi:mannose/fructose-specific phosphotransferase system component IIA